MVSGNEAERLLSHLNSVEPSIQFTLEREKDRHLPFLDLNVSRGERKEREPATGFGVILYTQGVTEPIKRILNTTLKLLKNLFRLWGILSPNLRILSQKNNEPTPFILFLAMTVTTNTSDRPNYSLQ